MAKFKDSLEYHSSGRKGKIEVVSTKPCQTAEDLSLAYSPGVAQPCLEIHKNPDEAYKYTAKGNLVAVVSNGTAVLGLGNLGALAGKPVMEGKGILFKRFADIDVFDIELNTEDPDEIIKACQLLEPTFGGINLEDIKAPECFYIEETLKKTMNIPVFHDDQHGTAIISSAALINALMLVGKRMEDIRIVVNGAGASANSCAKLAIALGVKPNNMIMCDTKGVIYKGRVEGMNPYKELFAADTPFRTLEEAANGADVLFGLSAKGAFTPEMVASMAPNPIIFAMANPDPEITPEEAHAVRSDVIMATGRSDYPNQVNNVLGFPFIFRGALDVRASCINEDMKLAAVHALAKLAREECPDSVSKAYGNEKFVFGPRYIIPKPFDPRVLLHVAPAIAQAAMDSGVARQPIDDMAKYVENLEFTQGKSKEIMRMIINKAKSDPKKIVFPEGETEKILRAAKELVEEGIAKPILVGDRKKILKKLEEINIELDVPIIDPPESDLTDAYSEELYRLRQRKGLTLSESLRILRRKSRTHFGSMMVHMGDADALLGGIDTHYPETIRPALEVIGKQKGLSSVHGLYMMVFQKGVYFLADTTVTIDPTAEELAETAILAAEKVRMLDIEPRVAMLSFSNFGSVNHPQTLKVKRAVEIVKERAPDLIVEGEMQADTAVVTELLEGFTFSKLSTPANILIFPDLNSGNICYKLLHHLGGAEAIGPILMGMNKPVHVLQRGDSIDDIVKMAALAVVDAQTT
ncbi:NADP-dependent malic enzyme [Pelotalea chapellei]|uniref:NADP-dependent malic enzyme n=1 Tax=Pelotalea chapellei TaxID=44671 RepID=A0ABS5UCY0_9BACT|nr:NADP-dependent malic enzyme [Pelotalea chapellei]MBT1073545.1 NADP-dependent malic enzyme [Pelotalea chapellei]